MLWYAAPIVERREAEALPSRLRDILVLLVGIPLVLAVVHLLVWWALFAVAAALCVARARFLEYRARLAVDQWDLVVAAATLLVASPNIVHPPIDGDSVGYHVPNAMAWMQSGSLDPTWMRYWWFPGGSELGVAGIVATGGIWIAGAASLLAALMLSTRLNAWLRELEVPALTAAAMSIAFLTVPAVAFQTYDERNDLVLAAWFLESLWLLSRSRWSVLLALAALGLVKPYGWVFVLIAALCMRAPRALLALIPLALWVLHDALLAPHARYPIGSTAVPSAWSTTILANMPSSLLTLAAALLHDGAAMVCLFFAPFVALFVRGEHRRIALAGTLSILFYLVIPFSFANYLPQLANGASLRYALPGIACGLLALVPLARAAPQTTAIGALAFAVAGLARIFAIFVSDGVTPIPFAAAAIVLALALLAYPKRWAAIASAVLIAGIFFFGTYSASTRAYSFYADEMPRIGSQPTQFFSWFAEHPHDAQAVDLAAGKLLAMAPSARIFDADSVACARAARDGAWVIVGTSPDVSTAQRDAQMEAAKRCGPVLFQDADVIVSEPRAVALRRD